MINRLFFFAISFTLLVSCSDDFTEITPVGALDENALQNERGVDLLLTGAYSVLDGVNNNQAFFTFLNSGDNWWFDVISDDAHKGSIDGDQPELFQLETFDWPTGNTYVLEKWISLFAGVNRSNAVISLIQNLPEEEGDFSEKLAEALFLRAHFNFELQKIYGNVPFISVENYENTDFNQPNPGPIWDRIEADFEFAMENLPLAQSDPGRPNSWTAQAFLGKVHLYQSNWETALNLLRGVIENGPYTLNAEFLDNFNAAGENGPESVFAIQFAADDGQSLNGNRGGTLNFPGGGPLNTCCGFYQPTQDLANAFKTDDMGLPLLDTYNQSDIANDYGLFSDDPFTPETGPLDPRIDYTIGRRGIDYNGYGKMVGKNWIRSNFSDISGPYLPKKNMYQAGEESENQGIGFFGLQNSGVNYNIMRFADILLMAAEAGVETGNLTLALDYVNRVRNRAKAMTYVQARDENDEVIEGTPAANYRIEPYDAFPNQEFARKAVRFERRLELGMEGHRLFDIRRWGNGVEIMNEYFINEGRAFSQSSFATKFRMYETKHDVLPIPLNAIDLSGNILKQNPGF